MKMLKSDFKDMKILNKKFKYYCRNVYFVKGITFLEYGTLHKGFYLRLKYTKEELNLVDITALEGIVEECYGKDKKNMKIGNIKGNEVCFMVMEK